MSQLNSRAQPASFTDFFLIARAESAPWRAQSKGKACSEKEACAVLSLFLRPLSFGLQRCSPSRVMSIIHGLPSKFLRQIDPQIGLRACYALLVLWVTAWRCQRHLALQSCRCSTG